VKLKEGALVETVFSGNLILVFTGVSESAPPEIGKVGNKETVGPVYPPLTPRLIDPPTRFPEGLLVLSLSDNPLLLRLLV
jgi:hypothetical protein